MPLYDLTHRTIYDNPIGAALRLPYGPSLQLIHPNGNFPIVHDPNIRQQSHIMGMFVLRPFCESWTQNILQADGDFSFYSVEGTKTSRNYIRQYLLRLFVKDNFFLILNNGIILFESIFKDF
jgi:hypothetical protein